MGELLDYEKLRIAKEQAPGGWNCIEPETNVRISTTKPVPEGWVRADIYDRDVTSELARLRSECTTALLKAKQQCDLAARLAVEISVLERRTGK